MSEQQPIHAAQPPDWTEVQRHCQAVWDALAGTGDAAGPTSPEYLLPIQGAGLLRFAARAVRLLQALDDTRREGGDFRPVLHRELATLGETLLNGKATGAPSEQVVAALWGSLLDTWQHVLAAVPVARGAPGSRTGALWTEYANASLAYAALLRDSSRRALDLLEAELSRRLEAGGELGSLRALYNLWVECSEQAHTEMLRQSRYSHAYGRLVNALLRCRRAAMGSDPPP